MLVFVAELDACYDVAEHRSAEHQVAGHQDLLDEQLVFRTEDNAAPQQEKPYDDGQEKEYSFDDLEKRIHAVQLNR